MSDQAERDEWNRWKTSVFGGGYMIWHEGLDVGQVKRLTGAKRKEAERMLAMGLRVGDTHAGEALAAMGATHMLPQVREALGRASSRLQRMNFALAIHVLEPSPDLIVPVIAQLRSKDHWGHRIDAAIALRRFEGERAVEAALTALAEDPEYLVRYHALDSAGHLLGLGSKLSEDAELFGLILARKKGEWRKRARARWAAAAEQVRARAASAGPK